MTSSVVKLLLPKLSLYELTPGELPVWDTRHPIWNQEEPEDPFVVEMKYMGDKQV